MSLRTHDVLSYEEAQTVRDMIPVPEADDIDDFVISKCSPDKFSVTDFRNSIHTCDMREALFFLTSVRRLVLGDICPTSPRRDSIGTFIRIEKHASFFQILSLVSLISSVVVAKAVQVH
eukprot:Tbor_TRINITY_DN10306_c0_g1::TRINITY_DN10306_c0_g1_i1::g.15944::m.15944